MGGTQHPLSLPTDSNDFVSAYMQNAASGYIAPAYGAPVQTVAVVTPEEFWPTFGTRTFNTSVADGQANLHNCVTGAACATRDGNAQYSGELDVFGYSQSAVVASLEKQALIDYYLAHPDETPPDVSFVLVANPMRPNGGFLERFDGLTIPILDVTFYGATPTDSDVDGDGVGDFPTTDVTRQYDGWADFPVYVLNPLATANAFLGIYYLHGDYSSVGMDDADYQGKYGDTDYYIIPTGTLPLLIPLQQLGVPSPLIKVLDAPLRVLVEQGYDRQTSPGVATTAKLIPVVNPVSGTINFLVAIPTGIDDGIEEVNGTRPLGTTAAGPYGVHVGDDLVGQQTATTPISPLRSQEQAPVLTGPDVTTPVAGTPTGGPLGNQDEVELDADAGTTTDTSASAGAVAKTRPLRDLIRNSFNAAPSRPSVTRPAGDGALKKLTDTLSSLPKLPNPLRPKPQPDSTAAESTPDAA